MKREWLTSVEHRPGVTVYSPPFGRIFARPHNERELHLSGCDRLTMQGRFRHRPILLRIPATRQLALLPGRTTTIGGQRFYVQGASTHFVKLWPWRPSPLPRRLP